MWSAMVAVGGVQVFCGFILILTDIICMALYYGGSTLLYLPLVFGVKYIITGSLGVAGGIGAGRSRGLAIASLVMSILSILSSFALIILSGLTVVVYSYTVLVDLLSIIATELMFFIVVFISSITMCVFAVRAMSSSARSTHASQVTYVVGQPGMVHGVGPQSYPAGQPGQYAAAQPYPAGQQGQYAAPYPQKA